jgi:protein-tyrosine-phosphatase
MDLRHRAATHAALGDPARLRMVDALRVGDLTVRELAEIARLRGNAAAHHLDVLERAGVIARRVSEGDRRRRYVTLRADRLAAIGLPPAAPAGPILFVCTHNSARSQFAAALWHRRTGAEADSAGVDPAARVHPRAVDAAMAFGINLRAARPKGYDGVDIEPALVVAVCDRAHEARPPFDAPRVHWSIPDPVRRGTASAFRSSFAAIADRVERLSPTAAS